MKPSKLLRVVGTPVFVVSLLFAPLAFQAMAQNTSTAPQSTPATQSSGSSSQTSKETTTTTTQSKPTETTRTETQSTSVNPLWIALGAIALLALLLIVYLSSRGRSGGGDTVYEKKTTIKRD